MRKSIVALVLATSLILALPAAAADAPPEPAVDVGQIVTLVFDWLGLGASGTAGEEPGNEIGPGHEPNGNEIGPGHEPNGNEIGPGHEPNGNEVGPIIEPHGNEIGPGHEPNG